MSIPGRESRNRIKCDYDFQQSIYRPAMTIAVDLGRKATKQTNQQPIY